MLELLDLDVPLMLQSVIFLHEVSPEFFSQSIDIQKQECIPVGCVPSAAVAISPAMHAPPNTRPLSCMPPAIHVPPPVDRILNTHLWKHYLSATAVADGKKMTPCKRDSGNFCFNFGRADYPSEMFFLLQMQITLFNLKLFISKVFYIDVLIQELVKFMNLLNFYLRVFRPYKSLQCDMEYFSK